MVFQIWHLLADYATSSKIYLYYDGYFGVNAAWNDLMWPLLITGIPACVLWQTA